MSICAGKSILKNKSKNAVRMNKDRLRLKKEIRFNPCVRYIWDDASVLNQPERWNSNQVIGRLKSGMDYGWYQALALKTQAKHEDGRDNSIQKREGSVSITTSTTAQFILAPSTSQGQTSTENNQTGQPHHRSQLLNSDSFMASPETVHDSISANVERRQQTEICGTKDLSEDELSVILEDPTMDDQQTTLLPMGTRSPEALCVDTNSNGRLIPMRGSQETDDELYFSLHSLEDSEWGTPIQDSYTESPSEQDIRAKTQQLRLKKKSRTL